MSTYETILYHVDNQVATLTLNNPARRNALSTTMLTELATALNTASEDEAVRAVVITGAEGAFCAGQDLQEMMMLLAQDGPLPEDFAPKHVMTYYAPVISAITEMPKPVLAVLNGPAAGAGASLALACDLRLMAEDASLVFAFSNIGLLPDAGGTWFLSRLVGYSRAYELAISGERISAERCLALGLTNRVVSAADLRAEGTRWAETLAQRPTLALGLTKQAMQYALSHSLKESIGLEARLQQQAMQSHDHTEGVTAFLQKRKAEFKGK